MDEATRAEAEQYASNLDRTLRELQRKVAEHEKELQKLRAQQPAIAAHSPKSQVQIAKTALQDVTDSEPFLPFPGSVLPALLALRRTNKTIVESRAYLASFKAAKDGVGPERERRRLETDQTNLRDQTLLGDALNNRIGELRGELASAAELDPDEAARERLADLVRKREGLDAGSKEIFRSLRTFIDERLAAMLAAEEMGGPVVGGMVDVDAGTLEAGFSAQGKPKKPVATDGGGARKDDGKRQQRLEETWGNAAGSAGVRTIHGWPEDVVKAAGDQIKELLQALILQLELAQGDNSRSYVRLQFDSAAARFLVRSKLAQFDPRDASRVRLVDFGKELDAS